MKLRVALLVGLLLVLPGALGHTTPTGDEQDIYEQAGSPTGIATGTTSGGSEPVARPASGTRWLVVAGQADTSGSATDASLTFAFYDAASYLAAPCDAGNSALNIKRDGTTLNPNGNWHVLLNSPLTGSAFYVALEVTSWPLNCYLLVEGSSTAGAGTDVLARFTPTGTVGEVRRATRLCTNNACTTHTASGDPIVIVYNADASFPASAPQNLTATSGPTIGLSWDAPASDGGSTVTNYKIYRGPAAGPRTLLATIGANASFVDANVAAGQTYSYNVTAVNAAGEGPASNNATATASGFSVSLSADPMRSKVKLSWQRVGTENPAISEYRVYRDNGSGYTQIATSPRRLTVYYDAAFNSSETCIVNAYRVDAVAGGSTVSSNVAYAIATATPELKQFGDDGAVYGGRAVACSMPPEPEAGDAAVAGYIEGGVEELGEELSVPSAAVPFMFGVVFILLFTFAGYQVAQTVGAIAGALVGLVFSVAVAFVPVWLVVLVAAVAFLGFLFVRGRGSGGGS